MEGWRTNYQLIVAISLAKDTTGRGVVQNPGISGRLLLKIVPFAGPPWYSNLESERYERNMDF